MSHLKSTVTLVAALVLAASSAPAQQFSKEQNAAHRKLYQQALAERVAGQLGAAEAKAWSLVRARPADPHMRRFLVEIQSQRRVLQATPEWQRRLSEIIVAQVDIEGAQLAEVLDYIRVKAEEKSRGRGAPSFVIRGEEIGAREITLKLKNVPLSEVLRYAGELADVKFIYEKHAIVVKDARRVAAEAAAEDAAEDAKKSSGMLDFRAPFMVSYADRAWGC